jgi:hypothetical protein
MSTEEQMQKLSRAADWRAALMILKDAFAGDQRVWQHVDLGRERIHFRTILDDGTFSSGRQLVTAGLA